jgi:hypothetical protein
VRPHAVQSAGGNSYLYDANGNLTSGGGRSFVYDGENRIRLITQEGTLVQLSYAPDGRRLKKSVTVAGVAMCCGGGKPMMLYLAGKGCLRRSGFYDLHMDSGWLITIDRQ